MKTWKKVSLALLCAVVLAACGGSSQPTKAPQQAAPQAAASEPNRAAQSPAEEPYEVLHLADPLEADSLLSVPDAESLLFQDLVQYCKDALEYEEMDAGENYCIRSFKGTSEQYELYKAYVQLLAEQPNLTLVQQYEKSFDDGSVYFSAGFDYTGNRPVVYKDEIVYTEDEANITIYGTLERKKLKLSVQWPSEMEITDLGSRYASDAIAPSLAGASVMAGLERSADGSFVTLDGRLSTTLGNAMVLRDGEALSAPAVLVRKEKSGQEQLWVENYYRDEGFVFIVPSHSVRSGDMFTLREMDRDTLQLRKGAFDRLRDIDNYKWTRMFGIHHGDTTTEAFFSPENLFEALTVRVMYYEEGTAAVYYVCAVFRKAPYEVEALCAVDLSEGGLVVTNTAVEEYSLHKGQDLTISCRREPNAKNELFRWEVADGEDVVTLRDVGSADCTVHGEKAGTTTVRAWYEWSETKPDVLTGIPRNSFRSRERLYRITVD